MTEEPTSLTLYSPADLAQPWGRFTHSQRLDSQW